MSGHGRTSNSGFGTCGRSREEGSSRLKEPDPLTDARSRHISEARRGIASKSSPEPLMPGQAPHELRLVSWHGSQGEVPCLSSDARKQTTAKNAGHHFWHIGNLGRRRSFHQGSCSGCDTIGIQVNIKIQFRNKANKSPTLAITNVLILGMDHGNRSYPLEWHGSWSGSWDRMWVPDMDRAFTR